MIAPADLDDPDSYKAVDSADALADVEGAAAQWAEAQRLAGPPLDLDEVDAIVVTGMGGSGICGDVIATLAAGQLGLPVVVHKGYGLPLFVGPRTLVAAATYSGTTEETRSALDTATRRGARRWVVTSGDALTETCAAEGIACVQVPGGGQPRHSLGSLVVPLLIALGLDDGLPEAVAALEAMAQRLDRTVPTADNVVKRVGARVASGGAPLLVGGSGLGALMAYRLRCQLAENAKLGARNAVLPEADHNEIVAWQGDPGVDGLLALRDPDAEGQRIARRFEVTLSLASRAWWTAELRARGTTPLGRLASLLLQVDLVSIYAALARGVDPSPIPNIERLKAELAR